MNTDLIKAKSLTIPQQQARRRIEFQVNRCRDKRVALKRLHLDAGTEYEINKQQLIEAETALEAFDKQIVEPESAELQAATDKHRSNRSKKKKTR